MRNASPYINLNVKDKDSKPSKLSQFQVLVQPIKEARPNQEGEFLIAKKLKSKITNKPDILKKQNITMEKAQVNNENKKESNKDISY